VPYQVFEVADGHVILAVGNDGQFAKFCEVAGRPELARDERFARNQSRVRHRAVLVPMLEAVMKARGKADWLAALEAAKVPCGPINDLAEVFAPSILAVFGDGSPAVNLAAFADLDEYALLHQAALWGLLAGIFNSIPYLGPLIVTGGLGVVMLGFSVASLNFAVQDAARCAAVKTTVCTNSGTTAAYAQTRYLGLPISPVFSYSTSPCAHTVTASGVLSLNLLPQISNVPLTASACYP